MVEFQLPGKGSLKRKCWQALISSRPRSATIN